MLFPVHKHTLEVGQVALLVERGALETEGVDNVVDLDSLVLGSLIVTALSRGIRSSVCVRLG